MVSSLKMYDLILAPSGPRSVAHSTAKLVSQSLSGTPDSFRYALQAKLQDFNYQAIIPGTIFCRLSSPVASKSTCPCSTRNYLT